MSGDIVVYLRGGRYEQSATIVFGSHDGGTNGHFVVYAASAGETPVVSGGKKVCGWKPVAGKKYYAAGVPVAAGYAGYFRQLYVNGVRACRASGPWIRGASFYDNPHAPSGGTGSTFSRRW